MRRVSGQRTMGGAAYLFAKILFLLSVFAFAELAATRPTHFPTVATQGVADNATNEHHGIADGVF